jgi:pSer/pThr/pTyr-binding forkhead associated (FHA) protein
VIRLLLRVGDEDMPREFADDAIMIGRASTNHVVLASRRVSRLHARIEGTGDGAQIVDLRSGNGTRLNGEKIDSDRLLAGDILQIGPTCLRVVMVDVSAVARIPVVREARVRTPLSVGRARTSRTPAS